MRRGALAIAWKRKLHTALRVLGGGLASLLVARAPPRCVRAQRQSWGQEYTYEVRESPLGFSGLDLFDKRDATALRAGERLWGGRSCKFCAECVLTWKYE